MGPARARSRAQAQGPGPHFLLNIGPGGRASGRLSAKTAKSQTWFISNMVYRLLSNLSGEMALAANFIKTSTIDVFVLMFGCTSSP